MSEEKSGDLDDLEPGIRAVLDRRAARKAVSGPYRPQPDEAISKLVNEFISAAVPGAVVGPVRRLGGGASKEQFTFTLTTPDQRDDRYVLRMEPVQSISESDRQREFDLLKAVQNVIPAPEPVWLDKDGDIFGQPAAIMRFVDGVTKPSGNAMTVSGLGTYLDESLRSKIGPRFVKLLGKIHALDVHQPGLSAFQVPDADVQQAARWQVNWWSRVFREDNVQPIPAMTLAECWMRGNLPSATDLVMVHGDYRTGNYLFDEATGDITAVLDWELAHIGDFHEDLAWMLQRPFGFEDGGVHLASGLYSRDQLLAMYERVTGRTVDAVKLHFYEIFAAYKCVVITLATGMKAARDRHNHQDVLLTWLAPAGYIFLAELCRLLTEGPKS